MMMAMGTIALCLRILCTLFDIKSLEIATVAIALWTSGTIRVKRDARIIFSIYDTHLLRLPPFQRSTINLTSRAILIHDSCISLKRVYSKIKYMCMYMYINTNISILQRNFTKCSSALVTTLVYTRPWRSFSLQSDWIWSSRKRERRLYKVTS